MKDLIQKPLKGQNFVFEEEKCLMLHISRPCTVNMIESEELQGFKISYKSHIERKSEIEQSVFFRFDCKMYTQGVDDVIYEAGFGLHKNVFMLAVCLYQRKNLLVMENVDDFIYGRPIQLKLYKHYDQYLAPNIYVMKQDKIKAADKVRDQTDERKLMHKNIDKVRNKTSNRKLLQKDIDEERDKTPGRKLMHKNVDEVRDKTPKRISMHRNVDEVRDKTPKRKSMHKNVDEVRNKTPKRKLMNKNVDEVRDKTPKRKAS